MPPGVTARPALRPARPGGGAHGGRASWPGTWPWATRCRLNQVLVEVETEKAVVELPSPFAGTVRRAAGRGGRDRRRRRSDHRHRTPTTEEPEARGRAGGEVPTLVGYGPAEAPPSRRRQGTPRAPRTAPRARRPPAAGRPLAAPPVRFMARQQRGRPGRRHRPRSRRRHHPRGPGRPPAPAPRVPVPAASAARRGAPVRGVQKHMAEAMVRSVATAPQACVFLTVDVTPTVQLVGRLRENRRFEGLRVTPLAVVARAVRRSPCATTPRSTRPGTTPRPRW